MKKLLVAAALGFGAVAAPFVHTPADAVGAMTCSPNPEPIGYACDALFGAVGAICRGEVPSVPRLPYIEFGWADPELDICPPLG